jgi:hypothetical protein
MNARYVCGLTAGWLTLGQFRKLLDDTVGGQISATLKEPK